ncbi:hypothetical protein JCM21900_003087 [Sporobolomyces salmonicolor]
MPRLPRSLAALTARPSSSSSSFTRLAHTAPQPPPALRTTSSSLFRPSPARSLLSALRPSLAPPSPSSSIASPILSLLAAPSSRFQPQQKRFAVYGNEYQPSQVRRKRKHGFLVRKRSQSGRRTLARRWMKGRKFLSH